MATDDWDSVTSPYQPPAQVGSDWDSVTSPYKPEKPAKRNKSLIADAVTATKIGVERLPSIATGIGDLVTAPLAAAAGVSKPIDKATNWLGEKTGFQPSKWADKAAAEEYSPATREALDAVDKAEGFLPTLGTYIDKPRAIVPAAFESLASTVAGGVAGRLAMPLVSGGAAKLATTRAAAAGEGVAADAAKKQLLKSGAIAGGVGEGVTAAGQSMSQISEDVDPLRAAGASLGAGAGTALLGAAGGRLAAKAGLVTPEAAIAAGTFGGGVKGAATKTGAALNYGKRIGGGAIAEGVFEEMPQSAQEQAWQNFAEGRPLGEGVGKAAAQGLVAGAAMGGAFNAMPRGKGPETNQERILREVSERGKADPIDKAALDQWASGYAQPAAPPAPPAPPQGPSGSFSDMNEFADFIGSERADLEQRRQALKPAGPLSAAVQLGTQTGAVQQGIASVPPAPVLRERDFIGQPSGSFSGMDELATLIGSERADVEARRQNIAQTQQLRKETELLDADTRVADQRAKESAKARDALLSNVLDNLPADRNPHRAWDLALQKAGYTDKTFTPAEVAKIQAWKGLVKKPIEQAKPEAPVDYAAPNELDPAALGIKERKPKVRQPQKIAEVQPAVAAPGPQTVAPPAAPAAPKPAPTFVGGTQPKTGGVLAQTPAALPLPKAGKVADVQAAPATVAKTATVAPGESWQTPRKDFLAARDAIYRKKYDAYQGTPESRTQKMPSPEAAQRIAEISHQHSVENAVKQGLPVPANVLADYPELAPKAAPATAEQSSPVAPDAAPAEQDPREAYANKREQEYITKRGGKAPLQALLSVRFAAYREYDREQGAASAEQAPATVAKKETVAPAEQAPIAPAAESPKLTTLKDRSGNAVIVSTAALNGSASRLRLYTKDGKSKGTSIHRDNLDPTGEKHAADTKEVAANPLFNVVTTKGGAAFASQPAARREMFRRGLQETHEVVLANDVTPGATGYVVRKKAEPQNYAPKTAPAAEESAPNAETLVASDKAVDALSESEANAVAERLGKRAGKDPYATIRAEHPDDIARAIAGDTWRNGRWIPAKQSDVKSAPQAPAAPAQSTNAAAGTQAVNGEGKEAVGGAQEADDGEGWMSLDEFIKRPAGLSERRARIRWASMVADAIAEGRGVPPEIVAELLEKMPQFAPDAIASRDVLMERHKKSIDDAIEMGILRLKDEHAALAKTLDYKRVRTSQEKYNEVRDKLYGLMRQIEALEQERRDRARGDFANAQGAEDYLVRRLTNANGVSEEAARKRIARPAVANEKAATHKDPGQPAEAATAPVVEQAVKKSARNTDMSIKEAREWLLGEIDKAIVAAGKQDAELKALLDREKAARFDVRSARNAQEGAEAAAAFEVAKAARIEAVRQKIGYVEFDVPGDGKFKVLNAVDNLTAFRDQVKKSPGFSANPSRPMRPGNGMAGGPSLEESIAAAKKDGGDGLAEIGNEIELARLRNKDDAALQKQFKSESGGKSYDDWRAEQEAQESAPRERKAAPEPQTQPADTPAPAEAPAPAPAAEQKPADKPANPDQDQVELAKVPPQVQNRINYGLKGLRDVERRLNDVIRARGRGQILALELKEVQDDIAKYRRPLDAFRRGAEEKGVDAEAAIRALGGEPDFAQFGEKTADDKPATNQPAPATNQPAPVVDQAAPDISTDTKPGKAAQRQDGAADTATGQAAESKSRPGSAEEAIAQKLRQIADEVEARGTNNGSRPLDAKWAEGAIKRLMDAKSVTGMLAGKQYGALASAKVALGKDRLSVDALRKIADKLQASVSPAAAEQAAPAPQLYRPAIAAFFASLPSNNATAEELAEALAKTDFSADDKAAIQRIEAGWVDMLDNLETAKKVTIKC